MPCMLVTSAHISKSVAGVCLVCLLSFSVTSLGTVLLNMCQEGQHRPLM